MDIDLRERFEEIRSQVSNIQGWISDQDGILLYKLARFNAPKPNIVELGSWKGKSTVWLASAIRDRGEGLVYAVDHWKGSNEQIHKELLKDYEEDQLYYEFLNNLKQLELLDYVKPIKMDTISATRQFDVNFEIGLLFIDASHEYEDVRRDFEFWSPMVMVGGFIMFHDAVDSWPGVKRVVMELPKWYLPIYYNYSLIIQKIK